MELNLAAWATSPTPRGHQPGVKKCLLKKFDGLVNQRPPKQGRSPKTNIDAWEMQLENWKAVLVTELESLCPHQLEACH